MSSRASILERVRKNKPTLETNINLEQFLVDADDLFATFQASVEANGGTLLSLDDKAELSQVLAKEVADTKFVDLTDSQEGAFDLSSISKGQELADVKMMIVPVKLGVAENAAIWLDDEILNQIRVLPFIVERTIFIINKTDVLSTMHHAYKRLGDLDTGFGSFIAGPSKTADIEQNLVIGAHGTKSHLVVLV